MVKWVVLAGVAVVAIVALGTFSGQAQAAGAAPSRPAPSTATLPGGDAVASGGPRGATPFDAGRVALTLGKRAIASAALGPLAFTPVYPVATSAVTSVVNKVRGWF